MNRVGQFAAGLALALGLVAPAAAEVYGGRSGHEPAIIDGLDDLDRDFPVEPRGVRIVLLPA